MGQVRARARVRSTQHTYTCTHAGKSNLMDAISFVLGVQSAHLRSGNLKELIHSSDIARQSENSAHVTNTRTQTAKMGSAPSLTAKVSACYENSQGFQTVYSRR